LLGIISEHLAKGGAEAGLFMLHGSMGQLKPEQRRSSAIWPYIHNYGYLSSLARLYRE